jgi:plastocyanin
MLMSSWLFCVMARAGEVTALITSDDAAVLSDVVVYVVPKSAAQAIANRSLKVAQVDQVGKEFVPLVSALRTGTAVEFPNSDNIRHQVYSFSTAKVFNLKLYSGKPAAPIVFDKAGVVTLGCNIHDQMIAWLLILDTPWFSKLDVAGMATFKDLPAGDYMLHAWHPGINAATHADSVSGSVRLESSGRVEKTLQVVAQSLARLRTTNRSGGDQSIAPPLPVRGAN